MNITLTKKFPFSASFKSKDRLVSHNYTLSVSTACPNEGWGRTLESKVRESLICHIDSRDLGLDVDFLKNIEMTEMNILKIFWGRLQNVIQPTQLILLSLESDAHTQWSLSKEA